MIYSPFYGGERTSLADAPKDAHTFFFRFSPVDLRSACSDGRRSNCSFRDAGMFGRACVFSAIGGIGVPKFGVKREAPSWKGFEQGFSEKVCLTERGRGKNGKAQAAESCHFFRQGGRKLLPIREKFTCPEEKKGSSPRVAGDLRRVLCT